MYKHIVSALPFSAQLDIFYFVFGTIGVVAIYLVNLYNSSYHIWVVAKLSKDGENYDLGYYTRRIGFSISLIAHRTLQQHGHSYTKQGEKM